MANAVRAVERVAQPGELQRGPGPPVFQLLLDPLQVRAEGAAGMRGGRDPEVVQEAQDGADEGGGKRHLHHTSGHRVSSDGQGSPWTRA